MAINPGFQNVGASRVASGQVALTADTPVQILAARPGRTRALLTVDHGSGVSFYVGPTSSVTSANGFAITLQKTSALELRNGSAVWAVAAGGVTNTVTFYEEFH